jgi:hypothetical protein
VYIGTELNSIIIYDLSTLRFTEKTYELKPKFAPAYQSSPVVSLQADENNRILYYTLSDTTKRCIDLTERTRRIPKPLNIRKHTTNKISGIHALADSGFELKTSISFCTISRQGELQKFWKQNDTLDNVKYSILNNPNFMNSKITHHKKDYITCSYLDKLDFHGKIYENLYVGTKNGFLIKFSFTSNTVEFVSNINDRAVRKIEIYHCTDTRSIDTIVFALCEDSNVNSGH